VEQTALRTITLDPARARNYEPAFREAVAEQSDDDYQIVMPFFIDDQISETWTWNPSMTGYVEQACDGQVARLQITWARKATVALVKVWLEDSDAGEPRWVARWTNTRGEVSDKVLNATTAAEAEEEAESFIFRVAYL
jgi:hypothetical protein